MAQITLKGNPINTSGNLPEIGSDTPDFTLVDTDLNEKSFADYAGRTVILNIFPSVDTPVCAASVRTFNEKAASTLSSSSESLKCFSITLAPNATAVTEAVWSTVWSLKPTGISKRACKSKIVRRLHSEIGVHRQGRQGSGGAVFTSDR